MKFPFVEIEDTNGLAPLFASPLACKDVPDHIEFHAEVLGTPLPEIKWYHNDIPISEEFHKGYHDGMATLSYPLERIGNENDEFHLEAKNEHGTAISKIIGHSSETSSDDHAPKILTPLCAQIVKTYSTLKSTVRFSGVPLPQIEWIRNGIPLQNDTSTKIEQDIPYTSSLTIKRMERNKGGKFEIIAKNRYGEARSSASVLVSNVKEMPDIVAPLFVQPLQPKLINIGDVVILEALVSSAPNCTFQWMNHGKPVRISSDVRIVTHDNKSILIMRHFKKSMQGTYTCRAENVGGSVTSSASVKLKEKPDKKQQFLSPRFVKPFNSYYLYNEGSSLELQCHVIGDPLPTVEWFHDGVLIEPTTNITMMQQIDGLCILRIEPISLHQSGEIMCMAQNKCGRSTISTLILVQGINIEQIRNNFLAASTEKLFILTQKNANIFALHCNVLCITNMSLLRNYWNEGLSQTSMGYPNGEFAADFER